MYIGRHIKYSYSCKILIELQFSLTDFRKILKFLEKFVQWDPSSMLTNGQTDRQTGMTKLIVAFGSFANVSKSRFYFRH